MKMNGITLALTAAFAAFSLADASAARADERIISCSSGGFTGYLKFVSSDAAGIHTNVRVYYRINKGTNSGGNHANVFMNDGGIAPTLKVGNADNGVQDNAWHPYYGPYHRGSGGVTAQFIFDKSNWPDPSCSKSASF